MIDNDYVLELDISFDKKILKDLILNTKKIDGLKPNQRSILQSDYLVEIKKRYPILGQIWNIYDLPAGFVIPKHIDSSRLGALNILIEGGEDTVTYFYQTNSKHGLYIEPLKAFVINEDLEETFKFTLTRPTLIRTDQPHSVSVGKNHRLVFSWGLDREITYEQARSFFKNLSG